MQRFMEWIVNIVIWTVLSLLIMLILNILVGFGIENNWFGTATSGISQLWPELLYPVGGLLILYNIIRHRPNEYWNVAYSNPSDDGFYFLNFIMVFINGFH